MSRIFAAIENARALAPLSGRLPAEMGRLPGRAAATDLALLRLWQALEVRLADRPRKVVQIVPAGADEADPAVAIRLARLAGRSMAGGVLVLNTFDSETRMDEDGIVAYGPLPGRSGDARGLNPHLLAQYWDRLGARAELIILDSPAVLASPLALALAPTVDGIILVVEAERTRAAVAEAARDSLRAGGANLLGVVLNKRRYHVPKAIYERL
jgi:hypothetical protein